MRRQAHKHTLAIAMSFGALSCGDGGDSNSDSASDKLCMDFVDKVEECKLEVDTSMGCDDSPSDAVKCAAECFVEAPCAEITGPIAQNDYYSCQAVCSGADPDAFICLDGAGFLPAKAVCDGIKQCPDSSDEKDCS